MNKIDKLLKKLKQDQNILLENFREGKNILKIYLQKFVDVKYLRIFVE